MLVPILLASLLVTQAAVNAVLDSPLPCRVRAPLGSPSFTEAYLHGPASVKFLSFQDNEMDWKRLAPESVRELDVPNPTEKQRGRIGKTLVDDLGRHDPVLAYRLPVSEDLRRGTYYLINSS
jgi:hypothetical protein